MSKRHLTVLLMFLLLSGICFTSCSKSSPVDHYSGFTRRRGHVFLMENHCHALVAWHKTGITNATLVHIDAHDDCRPVPEESIERTRRLLKAENYSEIFMHSDTEQFLNFEKKDSELLYDLGNFIYPAMELGIVSDVYWVIPQPLITPDEQKRLAALMLRNLPNSQLTDTRFDYGGFEIGWKDHLVRVITFEELPEIPQGCILDLDIDVFSFPRAMSEQHLIAQVNRDPAEVFKYLNEKIPDPAAVTISASVWGGYLPLMLRFLAEAAFDYFTEGDFPQDAEVLLTAYEDIAHKTPVLPEKPEDPAYLPASLHMKAMLKLAAGNTDECFRLLKAGADISSVYRKAFLDAAEALIAMQKYDEASDFIDYFEIQQKGPTYNSLAVRSMLLLRRGSPELAVKKSRQLIDWDSNPYTLLIYGSVLTSAGMTAEAEAVFHELLALAPHNAAAHYNLGLIRQRAGDMDEAVDFYKKALEIQPDFRQAHENLAYLLLERGELNEAEILLRRLLESNPDSTLVLNNLALVLIRQGRSLEAVPLLQRGLSLLPESESIKLNLAEALFRAGRFEEAQQFCRQLLKEKPSPQAEALSRKIDAARQQRH